MINLIFQRLEFKVRIGLKFSQFSIQFRNQFVNIVEGKETPIGDKWFYALADWAALPVKKQYWATIPTPQFIEVISGLENAKKSSRISVLICETGLGKTYSVERFVHTNPQHTYKITVSDAHSLKDIIAELMSLLGIPQGWSTAVKLGSIAEKFKELKRNGASPIVIIDEAENLKLPVIKSLKALYDFINGYASICLIGTKQLIRALERMKKNDRSGVPQFWRRIKASIRYINTLPDFKPFYDKYVEDKSLRRLLNDLCENYGELHDYLEPALREADVQEQPLTENFFRIMYNMPKY